jgi:hypothetical protein
MTIRIPLTTRLREYLNQRRAEHVTGSAPWFEWNHLLELLDEEETRQVDDANSEAAIEAARKVIAKARGEK